MPLYRCSSAIFGRYGTCDPRPVACTRCLATAVRSPAGVSKLMIHRLVDLSWCTALIFAEVMTFKPKVETYLRT